MLNFAAECARAGGGVLNEHFGRVTQVRTKESLASVVTEADLAAERRLSEFIQARHPQDGFLGEETGWRPGTSGRTWIVDPLDGTSNFVAGLPWFGTMVALVEGGSPVLAALYLPVADTLYTAEAGHGAHCNGKPIHVTREAELGRLLIAYSLDSSADPTKTRRDAELLVRVLTAARNIRATNSLVDFCYTAEGKLGGAINQSCKLWDIAAPWLLVREAGGRVTDVAGQPSVFAVDEAAVTQTHTLLGAAPAVHAQLLALARAVPGSASACRG